MNSSSNEERAGWPRLRYLPAAELRTYQVAVQRRPRGPLVILGLVTRFGSLPSMRGWKAQSAAGGAWTRKRQQRAEAAADLVAAQCVYCVVRPGGETEHLLTLGETEGAASFVVNCAEHRHEPVRPAVADFSAPVPSDY